MREVKADARAAQAHKHTRLGGVKGGGFRGGRGASD